MEKKVVHRRSHIPPSATISLVVAYLAVLFTLDAGKDALAVLDGRGPAGPLGFLTDAVPWWGAWVPLLLVGLTLARRVAPDRVGWLRSVGANVGMSVLMVVTHVLIVSVIFDVMSGPQDGMAVVQRMRRLGTAFLMPELLTVWGAVALLYSYHFGARLQAKELEAVRLEVAMSEARLETLKREISPHFLFNALNSVGGLVRSNRAEDATEMLDALATLLRRSLDGDDRAEIRLDEEMYLLDQYIRVEKARWGDALTVVLGISEGLESAAVPPLVLQPLVENAIRYGLDGGGTIRVDATERAGRLTIVVLDPGSTVGEPGPSGFGIGLSNTRERLSCLYGADADLSITPVPGGGTSARISVPLRHLTTADTELPCAVEETIRG